MRIVGTMKNLLTQIGKSEKASLYEVPTSFPVQKLIFSSKETRDIVNDPLFYGTEYLQKLRDAMTSLFDILKKNGRLLGVEKNAMILHVLRGGLNFGLIDALYDAIGWNRARSAFISSQRVFDNEKGWHISENRYQKIYIPEEMDLILGDVVATGVSLEHALRRTIELTKEEGKSVRSICFITIGGERAFEIVEKMDKICRESFSNYVGAQVIFIEGIFQVASDDSALKIKLQGTDLLRTGSVLAPELVDSQFEKDSFPLERCTIYDAGSRAFYVDEYLEDVRGYWEQVLKFAQEGLSYEEYLDERFPEWRDLENAKDFDPKSVLLSDICEEQIKNLM